MANQRLSMRSDPFIQQDPNSSPYNQRLSKERWEALKPTLSEMYHEGRKYPEMLSELQSMDINATRSQLEYQMKKWGFHKFKKEPTQQQEQTSESASLSDRPFLGVQIPDLAISVAPAPDEKAPCSNADLSSPALELSLENGRCCVQVEDIFPSTGRGLKAASSSAATTLHHTTHGCNTTPAEMTAHEWGSNVEITSKGTNNTSSTSLMHKENRTNNSSVLEAGPSSDLTGFQAFRVSTPPLEANDKLKLHLPFYASSTVAERILSRISFDSSCLDEEACKLHRTAKILYILECFGEAFDVFFGLTRLLNDATMTIKSRRHLRLIFAVSSCLRSAQTQDQIEIARDLVAQTRDWLWRRHSMASLVVGEFPPEIEVFMILAHGLRDIHLSDMAYWMANRSIEAAMPNIPIIKYLREAGLLDEQSGGTQDPPDTLSSEPSPPLARSCRSSISSGYRSFKALSMLVRNNASMVTLASLHSTFSGKWSERMSWSFSSVTGLPSGSSLRESVRSSTSDVEMAEDGEEIERVGQAS